MTGKFPHLVLTMANLQKFADTTFDSPSAAIKPKPRTVKDYQDIFTAKTGKIVLWDLQTLQPYIEFDNDLDLIEFKLKWL